MARVRRDKIRTVYVPVSKKVHMNNAAENKNDVSRIQAFAV